MRDLVPVDTIERPTFPFSKHWHKSTLRQQFGEENIYPYENRLVRVIQTEKARIELKLHQTELDFAKPGKSWYEKELAKYEVAKEEFMRLLPDLLKKHKGKYAAIAEGKLEIGDDKTELRNRIVDKYGPVSMYLSQITRGKRVIRRRPRPRALRK